MRYVVVVLYAYDCCRSHKFIVTENSRVNRSLDEKLLYFSMYAELRLDRNLIHFWIFVFFFFGDRRRFAARFVRMHFYCFIGSVNVKSIWLRSLLVIR